jgi:malate permease and related proteins
MTKLAIVAFLFLAGVLARRMGWLGPGHGARLLRFVVTFGLPALIIGSVSRIPIEAALLALPATAAVVMLSVGVVAFIAARMLKLARPTEGALIVSAMAMNLAFVFPFVFLAWGPEALARTVLFDTGNSITQWTVVYFLATRYGGHAPRPLAALRRVVLAPPFMAVVVALALNRFAPAAAAGVLDALRYVGQALTLLVVLAMGVLFEARRLAAPEVLTAVGLRCGLGVAIAALTVRLLGLEPSLAAVAVVGSAAPAGFSSVVMSEREGLDLGLAVAVASLSALIALGLLPALLYALRP